MQSQGSRATPKESSAADASPLPAPDITAGADPAFINTVIAIEKALAAKNFGEAKSLAGQLPVRKVTIEWDDTAVPEERRQAYFSELRDAVSSWAQGLALSIKVYSTTDQLYPKGDAKPEIKFDFQPVLAKPQGQAEPLAVALFAGSTGKPMEAVIGLNRGTPPTPSTPMEVGNDVRYAIGKYLGVADSPVPSSLVYHVNGHTVEPAMGIPPDRARAARCLSVADDLRDAIAAKKPMQVAEPSAFVSPTKLKVDEEVVQGDVLALLFQVTNNGTGTLNAELLPDCSCFSVPTPLRLAAGETGAFKLAMDTSPYSTSTHKELFVFTNDPDEPLIRIPVDVAIIPSYLFNVIGGNEQGVGPDASSIDVTLKLHDSGTKILGWTVDPKGFLAELVDKGSNGDPAKFRIKVPAGIKNQRVQVTLNVSTTDPKFSSLHQTFYVQNGIVASPSTAFTGPIAGVGQSFKIVLNQPGKSFRVLGASISSKSFKVTTSGSGLGERHSVTLTCVQQGLPGRFQAVIKVQTDDPSQKVIQIPVEGSFK